MAKKHNCPNVTPPKFEFDSCKEIASPIEEMKLFYNHKTKEVFDQNQNFIGFGELQEDGELKTLNVKSNIADNG